jgi:hypothetical protein
MTSGRGRGERDGSPALERSTNVTRSIATHVKDMTPPEQKAAADAFVAQAAKND